jgi:hypothetical protein
LELGRWTTGELVESIGRGRWIPLEPGVGPEAGTGSGDADQEVAGPAVGGVPRLEHDGAHEATVSTQSQHNDDPLSAFGREGRRRKDD